MNQFTIIYEGVQISNNQMKALHWRKLKPLVDQIKLKAKLSILKVKPKKMERFTIECRYNSRLDPDNIAGSLKPIIDQLVKMGVFPNDSKKHWRGLNIIPDETLKHNSLHLKVTECTQL